MYRVAGRICCVCFLLWCAFIPATVGASPTHLPQVADVPTVNPDYIYDQLFYMVTHFQHREAGYISDGISNGHDAFANYWAQEMERNVQSFGAQVYRDTFDVGGWDKRPATAKAFNVEVTIPGGVHPEQVVVIGCHYDGMAISTQSANDDASGCAIELGVAQAMAKYWQSHHVYPARTLRFVIFDAEEQGLYGSFHYLNSTVNGDVQNIVAMFNEEQNGIAYPLRYLGQAANPLLPFYIEMSPLQSSRLYPDQNKLSQVQQDNIKHFRNLMQQAVIAAFAQFQALGYEGLTYHTENNQDVAQPIFTSEQISNIHQEEDTMGGSDQIPFTLAGLPCATFVGNSTYYDGGNPPPWSYPFDQTQDTIQLMNTFADGSSQKAHALTLSLALPGMLTTWMLHQSSILGETGDTKRPFVAISDIGSTQVNTSVNLDAKASFNPTQANTPLSYTWNFGDGTTASGMNVTHTYTKTGNYTLELTARSASSSRSVSKTISVTSTTIRYKNPYEGNTGNGNPPHNPDVQLPQPNDSLSDKVVRLSPQSTASQQSAKAQTVSSAPYAFVVGTVLLIGALVGSVGIALLISGRRR